MVKVSVIVPVYNSEKYLKETVSSLLNQSLRDIEIVLVDDGSTDTSGEICESLKKEDKRILVFHQTNLGICKARNKGIEVASGEYIAFCDNDDAMMPNCLELSYSCASQFKCDVVRFRRKHELVTHGITIGTSYKKFSDRIVEIKDWSDYITVINACGYGVWAGIVSNKLIKDNNISFNSNAKYGYEDHIFVADILGKCKKLYLLNDILYVWKQRKKGSTSCIVGEEVLQNRIDSIKIWQEEEKKVKNGLTDRLDIYRTRQYDYAECLIEEVLENRSDKQDRIKKINQGKKELLFNDSLAFDKTIIQKAIDNNDLISFKKCQFKRRITHLTNII